ncbi:MAG: ketoacyl-ACP synthase III [Oscillospiraceae bacterium]|nr:ketoacyl-ACP synthase III [Oscillospiraceae bacterium]
MTTNDSAGGAGRVQVHKGGGIGVLGLGAYIPDKVVSNFDLEKLVDTTDEWIVQRTGIRERRVVEEGETVVSIAKKAAELALADAGISGGDVGLVIVATATPDYFTPAAASLVQHAIGARACAAFDLNAGCSGSLYALIMARAYIESGACDYALVIGAEILTRAVDWDDRKTCILFGDAAGAAVVGRVGQGRGFLSSMLRSDGEGASMITIPAYHINEEDLGRRGGVKKPTVWLEGRKVMKFASRAMSASVEGVAAAAGLGVGDVRLVVPHQANLRIIENASKRLGLAEDRVFVNIHKYGNTSAASILVSLHEAEAAGMVKDGDHVALVAFGAGLTYGAALMRM